MLRRALAVANEVIAGARLSHPPRAANHRGDVKCQYVTIGVRPMLVARRQARADSDRARRASRRPVRARCAPTRSRIGTR